MTTLELSGVDIVCPADAPEDEWLAERRNGIGGSDIAAAVGINPYDTPLTLWLDKTGRPTPTPSDKQREAMKWGRLLEPVLRDEFQWLHPEYQVTTAAGTYARPSEPWQRVNVDGLVWSPGDGRLAGIWEGKTGTHWQLAHWRAAAGDDGHAVSEIPVRYTAQVQWAMYVTGAPCAFVSALLDTSTYVEAVIPRDDDLIGDLIGLAGEFWLHVLTDTMPPVDGSEVTRAALARIDAHDGKTLELDAEWAKDIARRHELHEHIKELEAEKAEIDNRLRAAMGDATIATLDGTRVATHKFTKARRTAHVGVLDEKYPEVAADPDVVTAAEATRTLRYSTTTTLRTTT